MTEGRGLKQKIRDVRLRVDGKPVAMKGFVQDVVGFTVAAMVSNLKGVSDPKEIELVIKIR
ncbi:MAG: hypothetical protein HY926_13745 [Elusimicrobia bacterium]|nr:hypothetical protein [Elusimicrobiota bacterium]